MSYDISLCDPVTHETLKADSTHFIAGGMRSIYGKTGAESIPMLEKAISALGDDVDDNDYWNATEGNAKRALCGLLAFAKIRPDGVWDGD